MLHQLRDGNWFDLSKVESIFVAQASHDECPESARVFIRSPDFVTSIKCDSLAAAQEYRDELARLANRGASPPSYLSAFAFPWVEVPTGPTTGLYPGMAAAVEADEVLKALEPFDASEQIDPLRSTEAPAAAPDDTPKPKFREWF